MTRQNKKNKEAFKTSINYFTINLNQSAHAGALQYIERARKMTLLNLLIFLKNTKCNFKSITIFNTNNKNKITYKYNITFYLNDTDFCILKDYLKYTIKEFITNDNSAIIIL